MASLKKSAHEARSKSKKSAAKEVTKAKSAPVPSRSSEFMTQSDLDSESKTDSEDETTTTAKGTKVTQESDSSTSESGSEGESEGESEGGEKSGSESDEDETPSPEATKPSIVAKEASEVAPTIAPKAFVAPKGFETLRKSTGRSHKSADIFDESSLEGKQIWYITAPSSVPISAIKKVSLKDVKKGKAALSLKGHDYGFVQDRADEKVNTKVVIPNGNGKYRIGKRPLDQILHLQQIVKLPSVGTDPAVEGAESRTSRATVPAKKPVRQQPEGLRMRFLPIGFGTGKTGAIGSDPASGNATSESGDDDTEEPEIEFQKPAQAPEDSGSDEEMQDAPVQVAGESSTSESSDEEMEVK